MLNTERPLRQTCCPSSYSIPRQREAIAYGSVRLPPPRKQEEVRGVADAIALSASGEAGQDGRDAWAHARRNQLPLDQTARAANNRTLGPPTVRTVAN